MPYVLKKGEKTYTDLFGMADFLSFEEAAECNYELLNNEYEIVPSEKTEAQVLAERKAIFDRLKAGGSRKPAGAPPESHPSCTNQGGTKCSDSYAR